MSLCFRALPRLGKCWSLKVTETLSRREHCQENGCAKDLSDELAWSIVRCIAALFSGDFEFDLFRINSPGLRTAESALLRATTFSPARITTISAAPSKHTPYPKPQMPKSGKETREAIICKLLFLRVFNSSAACTCRSDAVCVSTS